MADGPPKRSPNGRSAKRGSTAKKAPTPAAAPAPANLKLPAAPPPLATQPKVPPPNGHGIAQRKRKAPDEADDSTSAKRAKGSAAPAPAPCSPAQTFAPARHIPLNADIIEIEDDNSDATPAGGPPIVAQPAPSAPRKSRKSADIEPKASHHKTSSSDNQAPTPRSTGVVGTTTTTTSTASYGASSGSEANASAGKDGSHPSAPSPKRIKTGEATDDVGDSFEPTYGSQEGPDVVWTKTSSVVAISSPHAPPKPLSDVLRTLPAAQLATALSPLVNIWSTRTQSQPNLHASSSTVQPPVAAPVNADVQKLRDFLGSFLKAAAPPAAAATQVDPTTPVAGLVENAATEAKKLLDDFIQSIDPDDLGLDEEMFSQALAAHMGQIELKQQTDGAGATQPTPALGIRAPATNQVNRNQGSASSEVNINASVVEEKKAPLSAQPSSPSIQRTASTANVMAKAPNPQQKGSQPSQSRAPPPPAGPSASQPAATPPAASAFHRQTSPVSSQRQVLTSSPPGKTPDDLVHPGPPPTQSFSQFSIGGPIASPLAQSTQVPPPPSSSPATPTPRPLSAQSTQAHPPPSPSPATSRPPPSATLPKLAPPAPSPALAPAAVPVARTYSAAALSALSELQNLAPEDLDLDFDAPSTTTAPPPVATAQTPSLPRSPPPAVPAHSQPTGSPPGRSEPFIGAVLVSPAASQALDALQTQQKYRRLLVLEVTEASNPTNKRLRTYDELRNTETIVFLLDDWTSTPIETGDYINIVGKPESGPSATTNTSFDSASPPITFRVDRQRNLLVLHPDRLISGTMLSQSRDCMRRAYLNEHCKSTYSGLEIDIKANSGTLIHIVFQEAIAAQNFSTAFLTASIRNVVAANIEKLFGLGKTEAETEQGLQAFVPKIQTWAATYFPKSLSQESPVDLANAIKGTQKSTGAKPVASFGFGNKKSSAQAQAPQAPSNTLSFQNIKYGVNISKSLAVEESIWSLMYGLKGSIDLTIEAEFKSGNLNPQTVDLPLELKSGAIHTAHGTQVICYALMMSDRYDREIKAGLLYSMQDNDMKGIPITRAAVIHFLLERNKLARYLARDSLPKMILYDKRGCGNCYQRKFCTIYHKAIEGGSNTSAGFPKDVFDEVTKHLTPEHSAFIAQWERLIGLEISETLDVRADIWITGQREREKLGKCLGGLQISEERRTPKGWQYKLVNKKPGKVLNVFDVQFHVGDYVMLSTGRHLNVATATVADISSSALLLSSRSRIIPPPPDPNESDPSSQRFTGLAPVAGQAVHFTPAIAAPRPSGDIRDIEDFGSLASAPPLSQQLNQNDVKSAIWRVDKEELTSGLNSIKANILELFLPDPEKTKLRRMVVDLVAPGFSSAVPPFFKIDSTRLNPDQLRAAQRVLSAKDYALILGMPGTGKTHTIAHIVQAIYNSNRTVLITAYTHSAVDNVLLKVKSLGVPFLRLGNADAVHTDLRSSTLNFDGSIKSIAELTTRLSAENTRVVATTCSGVNAPLLQKKSFDYCIVDEASQITLPLCLGPLKYAQKFVLVGDLYQLPPLVKNAEARSKGMAESLFKRLAEAHPDAVSALQYQYRMNESVVSLANELIYSNRLKCGTPAVAKASLVIPNIGEIPKLAQPNSVPWLSHLLRPENHVVFANLDQVPAEEGRDAEQTSDIVRNEVEAQLVVQTAEALLAAGVPPDNIGIISPWRSQLKSIHHFLVQRKLQHARLEVLTVDKYQGRDKECVLFSLVRSNPQQIVGALLRDWRRINVALTRAKQKLIIFGSKSTLQGTPLFSTLLKLIEDRQWRYDMPPKAESLYTFPDPKSSTNASLVTTQSPSQRFAKRASRLVPQ